MADLNLDKGKLVKELSRNPNNRHMMMKSIIDYRLDLNQRFEVAKEYCKANFNGTYPIFDLEGDDQLRLCVFEDALNSWDLTDEKMRGEIGLLLVDHYMPLSHDSLTDLCKRLKSPENYGQNMLSFINRINTLKLSKKSLGPIVEKLVNLPNLTNKELEEIAKFSKTVSDRA